MSSNNLRLPLLIIIGVGIIGIIGYLESIKVTPQNNSDGGSLKDNVQLPTPTSIDKSNTYSFAYEVSTPNGYINTEGITVEELIGKKVILIDFWTYSCINCQRTTPFLNAWYEKYSEQGLEILGVHTPEFDFEKKYENVLAAVKKLDIQYPVILDNDFSTWNAYRNRYWPRKYLIDIDGYIVYDHIGEGGYDKTERVIQELLAERNIRLQENIAISDDMVSPDNIDIIESQSPEVYFGAWRNDLLGNGIQRQEGVQEFLSVNELKSNTLYFLGTWDIKREFAANQGSGSILFVYNAKKVFMVASGASPVSATILIDGEPVGSLAGNDVDEKGTVIFDEERLYNLIDDSAGPSIHILEIRLKTEGLEAYTFTFG